MNGVARRRMVFAGLAAVVIVAAGATWWWVGRSGATQAPRNVRGLVQNPSGSAVTAAGGAGVPDALQAAGRELLRLSEQAGVQAVPVQRGTIERTIEATGSIVAGRDVSLTFGQGGRIETVSVEEGQRVGRGSILATLESTQQELAYVRARNEYEAGRVDRGPSQVEELRLAMESAKRQLDQTRLSAPFDGVVAEVSVSPGDQVTASAGVVRLVDLSTLKVEADVDEVDLPFVKAGQPAVVTVKSYPGQQWEGEVASVGAAGRVQGDLVLFDVAVAVRSADPRLMPGMSATVSIVVERAEDALVVPEEAVAEMNGQAFVTRLEGGSAVPTRVTLGPSDGRRVAILSGLDEGDRVLATNYALYRRMAEGQATTGQSGGARMPAATFRFAAPVGPGGPGGR